MLIQTDWQTAIYSYNFCQKYDFTSKNSFFSARRIYSRTFGNALQRFITEFTVARQLTYVWCGETPSKHRPVRIIVQSVVCIHLNQMPKAITTNRKTTTAAAMNILPIHFWCGRHARCASMTDWEPNNADFRIGLCIFWAQPHTTPYHPEYALPFCPIIDLPHWTLSMQKPSHHCTSFMDLFL